MSMEPQGTQQSLDFAKVIIRRKGLFLGVLVLALAMGAAFAFLTPKVYIVDMLIEVGTYPGFEGSLVPLENPHQLTEKIASGSFDNALKTNLGIPQQRPLGVKSDNPDNTNLVRVYIHSSQPEEALPILSEMGELVIADHAARAETHAVDTLSGFVPTEVTKDPTVGTKPLNDRPILVMVFALFVGGVFGLLAIFSKEWWRRSLEE